MSSWPADVEHFYAELAGSRGWSSDTADRGRQRHAGRQGSGPRCVGLSELGREEFYAAWDDSDWPDNQDS
jgi:hypothetical protein